MTLPAPDGYWIERAEYETVTHWFVHADKEPAPPDTWPSRQPWPPHPLAQVNVWRFPDQTPFVTIVGIEEEAGPEPAFARAFAMTLNAAADEAEGHIRND